MAKKTSIADQIEKIVKSANAAKAQAASSPKNFNHLTIPRDKVQDHKNASYNLEAGRKRIEELEERRRAYDTPSYTPGTTRPYDVGQKSVPNTPVYSAANYMANARPYAAGTQAKAETDPTIREKLDLDRQIAQLKQEYNQAKHYKESMDFAYTASRPDFKRNIQLVDVDDDLYNYVNYREFQKAFDKSYQTANPNQYSITKSIEQGSDKS